MNPKKGQIFKKNMHRYTQLFKIIQQVNSLPRVINPIPQRDEQTLGNSGSQSPGPETHGPHE